MSKIEEQNAYVQICFSYTDYNPFFFVHVAPFAEIGVSNSSPDDSRNLSKVGRCQNRQLN